MLIIGKVEAIDDAMRVLQGHFQEFGETIWRKSCKEENDNYTMNTRANWWKGG